MTLKEERAIGIAKYDLQKLCKILRNKSISLVIKCLNPDVIYKFLYKNGFGYYKHLLIIEKYVLIYIRRAG